MVKECLINAPELSKFSILQLIEKLNSRLDNTKVNNIYNRLLNDKLTGFDNEDLEDDYIKAIIRFTLFKYAFNKVINQPFPDLITKIVQSTKFYQNFINLHNINEDHLIHLIYQYKYSLYKEFNKLKENDDDNDFKKDMKFISIGRLYELVKLKGLLTDELLQVPTEEIRKLCLKSLFVQPFLTFQQDNEFDKVHCN
ncbi:hypothetical protein U3516DRAFT_767408 [Neocallimastix sp. 'constans']